MIQVANVALPLDAGIANGEQERLCRKAIAKHLGCKPADIVSFELVRRSVDARKRDRVHFVATFALELADTALEKKLLKSGRAKQHVPSEPLVPEAWPADKPRPLVVGMGPAGLFAGLYLALAGAKPLVIERGAAVEQRSRTVEAFNEGAPLDVATNIQFGEGGAGTFSDGKLTTNTKNPRIAHVLRWFVDAGAPEEILWQAKPHIGSDRLPGVVAALRERIIELGGEVRHLTLLDGLTLENGHVVSANLLDLATGQRETVPVRQVVLATGHSARDTFELVHEAGFAMEQKAFAVGVRIEHRQAAINRAQWGKAANHPALGAADYKLVAHLENGRSVYTFCMCPGGEVVCAASEEHAVVTNGMSNFARDGENANAALLVNVRPEDFGSSDVLAGVALQRQIEHAAYDAVVRAGGSPYQAPCQTVGSLLGVSEGEHRRAHSQEPNAALGASGGPASVSPTYARGTIEVPLSECLPDFVVEAIREALPQLDRKLKGFADPAAVMTAPESRSSSPVRLIRGADLQAFLGSAPADPKGACGATGLYPCGEGAGYAGGIMSASVDGLRIAEALCMASC